MRKGKKGRKREYPSFFLTQETTPWEKKNSLPLPIPLNKTPSFFKFIKTPTSTKKTPFESRKNLDI
jgi:hypothetical protein